MRDWQVYGLGMPFVVQARSREHAELVVGRLHQHADPLSLWIREYDCATSR